MLVLFVDGPSIVQLNAARHTLPLGAVLSLVGLYSAMGSATATPTATTTPWGSALGSDDWATATLPVTRLPGAVNTVGTAAIGLPLTDSCAGPSARRRTIVDRKSVV